MHKEFCLRIHILCTHTRLVRPPVGARNNIQTQNAIAFQSKADQPANVCIQLRSCDLDLDPMTLIVDLDLYVYQSEVCRSRHLEVIVRTVHTGRHTDATERITTRHSRMSSKRKKSVTDVDRLSHLFRIGHKLNNQYSILDLAKNILSSV